MPPKSSKRPKNTKRIHMVFFVHTGRVQVDISGVQFSAGKGCVFHVPCGNSYSFTNNHAKTASLFFTQRCIPLESEESSVMASAPAPAASAAAAPPPPAAATTTTTKASTGNKKATNAGNSNKNKRANAGTGTEQAGKRKKDKTSK